MFLKILLLLTLGTLIYFITTTVAGFASYRVSSAFTGSSDLAFLPHYLAKLYHCIILFQGCFCYLSGSCILEIPPLIVPPISPTRIETPFV